MTAFWPVFAVIVPFFGPMTALEQQKKHRSESCDAIPYFAERPRFRRASPSGISWGSLIEVKHIGITDLRSSGAFPLNDPYESELSTGHPSKKHRS